MRIREAISIYHVLEQRLRQSQTLLTCVALFDDPDVKKFADSAARVSDYLGHMYRRGLLGREPAPKSLHSQARWGYFWKNRDEIVVPAAKVAVPTQPTPEVASVRKVLSKPNIEISDNGGTVVIDLPELTITIRSKT